MKKTKNRSLGLWGFVIFLNVIALLGVFYLKSSGIDLYSFRAGS